MIKPICFVEFSCEKHSLNIKVIIHFVFFNEQQDERQKFVSIGILSDTLPEPDETIIVYLAQPTGDARIATGTPDGGKKVIVVGVICYTIKHAKSHAS